MIHIGIIGCGHWGPNHIRIFSFLRESKVIAAADLDTNRLEYVAEQHPEISIHKEYMRLLENPRIDAIVVSTPTHTHYTLVKASLLAGKHVLCEKPLCQNVTEGEELLTLARQADRILMVGHIFLFNPGIIMLKNLIKTEDLGRIYYLSATRTNLGPIRNDVNVVYDLATHDISIFNFLFDSSPLEVSSVGAAFLQETIEDVAFISLTYPQHIMANIRVSWLDPRKVRQITVVGDKKMATWDDLATIGPVIIYDKGVAKEPYYNCFGEFQLLSREGDITIPKIKMEEPLKLQNQYFLSCLKTGKVPISDGVSGVKLVKTLSAINKSLILKGQSVPVI